MLRISRSVFDGKLVVAAALMATVTGTAAASDQTVSGSIARLYLLRCTALMDPTPKNQDAADALLSPGFEGTDARGLPVARQQYNTEFAQIVSRVRATGCYNTLKSVTSSDSGTAVSVNTLHLDGILRASAGDHQVALNETSQDTWSRPAGEWTISQSKILKLAITIDGHVFSNESP